MTQALKTQTKPVTKTAAKPAAKAVTKPAAKTAAKVVAKTAKPAEKAVALPTATAKAKPTSAEAGLIAFIVEGIAKRVAEGSTFYKTALAYHARHKTTFPRARNNERRAALKREDAETVFSLHDKKILAPGNGTGQAMLDVYMMTKH